MTTPATIRQADPMGDLVAFLSVTLRDGLGHFGIAAARIISAHRISEDFALLTVWNYSGQYVSLPLTLKVVWELDLATLYESRDREQSFAR